MLIVEEIAAAIDNLDYVDTLHIYFDLTKKLDWINLVTLSPEDVGRDSLAGLAASDFYADLKMEAELEKMHDTVCDFAERKLSND
jgi:hypothetical protein